MGLCGEVESAGRGSRSSTVAWVVLVGFGSEGGGIWRGEGTHAAVFRGPFGDEVFWACCSGWVCFCVA